MKIKNRFIVNMIFFGAMLFVIAASLVFTEEQTERLNKQEEIAVNIEREASELSYLSDDYLLYREKQQKNRWETKFASLSAHLHDLRPNSPEQEKLVTNISENLKRLEEVFTDISFYFENGVRNQGAPANLALVQVPWSRMAVQSQGIIFDALRLTHLFEAQSSQFKRVNVSLILALLGIFSAYFFINYLLVYRRLLKSLANLQVGTRIVGSGNLNYKLADETKDEIGELGQAFDKMTTDLREVKASKTELEKEIAERKKVEEALKKSEEKYHTLFDSMSEAFTLIEPLKNDQGKFYDYRFLEINLAWEKIFGYSREKVLGKTALEINPKLEPYWIENFGQVASSGQPIRFGNHIGRLDKWLETHAYPVGEKTVATIITDVTHRKKAEELLIKEKEFSENILEAIPDGMSIVDENAKIIHLNRSFKNIFGRGSLGKRCYEIFKDDKKQCDLCPLRESVKIGETKTIEISGIAGGRTFSISHTGIAINGKKHILEFFKDMTDYKKAEKFLKQSEEKYRSLYNSIRDGIVLTNTDGVVIDCNQTFLNMLGYGEEEIKRMTYKKITPSKWWQMEEEIIEHRVLSRGYSGVYEKEYRRKDGTIFPISIQVWLVRDEQGKPKGMWAMINDITFRKKRDEEMASLIKNLEIERAKREDLLTRIANERDVLDALMRNTKAQLAYMDKSFNFIAANAAYCQGCGKSEAELIGKNYFRFFPDKENEVIFKKVIDTASPIEFSAKPFIFPDRPWIGVTYWDWTLTPVKDASGKAFGLVISLVDVTERIKTEQEISSYARKLEQITAELQKVNLAVENASDLIWIADPTGTIIFANKASADILGYLPQELIGKKLLFWVKEAPADFQKKLWATVKSEKKPFFGEAPNKRKDGYQFIAEIHIAPVLDKEQNILFFVGIERDVTEAKNLDRAKTEFISLAAHQLRTPIATISLTAEMLTRGLAGEINEDAQKYLGSIVEHVGKMTEMIETFLNISRIELGTFEIKPKPTNLLRAIEENIEDVMPLIQNKKIKLKKSFPAGLPLLNIDLKIIHMVLENLLSNAIKYTLENGTIEVTLSLGQEIVIKIADNGLGIPENQQSQVFQKMFRADNVRDTKVEGVGLGLYLVKTLMEQSGGRIWFESKEGRGTTFYVSLPLSGMKEKTRNSQPDQAQ